MLESVNLGLELRKRVTHNFSTLRTRSLDYKQNLISEVFYFGTAFNNALDPIAMWLLCALVLQVVH